MSASDHGWATNGDLFPKDLLSADEVVHEIYFRPVQTAVWSHHKARLIELYLHFFVMVTRHGAYIDGFAGPQYPEHPDAWSAKRVMENRPRSLQKFFLCELDPEKTTALNDLWESQPPRVKPESKRVCRILPGDFNASIDEILSTGKIRPKEATFALLDQRTFECHWSTVQKLAQYKPSGELKIELFYFLATKWLHRALAGVGTRSEAKVDLWWGSNGWRRLKEISQIEQMQLVTKRFKSELGYRYATPFPIYEKEDGQGAIMYYMIHATDHSQAPGLMYRAYRQAVAILETPPTQELLPWPNHP